MIRAFVAIDIPEELLRSIERVSISLRSLQLDSRSVNVRSIHLTLKFLGGVEENRIADVCRAVQLGAGGTEPFEVSLRRVGVFPQLARPRVVWVGVDECQALLRLQAKMEESLEAVGFPREKRAFRPHLTLMRLKSKRNLAGLARYIQQEGTAEEVGSFQVEECHLYQSLLRPGGAKYRRLFTLNWG